MSDVPQSSFSARRCLWAASIILLLGIIHTYPLITGLDHLSRHNDDEWLNAWAVSWIAHQLVRNPLSVFDANMFYPHEQAFAYTEPLLIPGMMGIPIHWLGSSPLLTYNVLLLLGMTLTGLAVYALVVKWTGNHWSGLLSGALFTFGTPMLTRLPHLQVQHFYWLPLALMAFDALMTKRRTRDAVWVGGCVLGAALTSGYTAVFVVFALGAALVVRVPSWWGRHGVGVLLRLAVVAAVTVGAFFLLLSPYREFQLTRPLPGVGELSKTLQMYLSSATYLHYNTWSQQFYEQAPGSFFPGVVAVVLAGKALVARRSAATPGVRSLLIGIAAIGFVMSLGTLTPVYAWVYELAPPFQSLRAPSRFAILPFFAVAVLAGLGFSQFCRRLSPKWCGPLAVGLLILATVEGRHGVQYRPVDWELPIYRVLADVDDGPVVELPIYRDGRFNRNAFYLLGSTVHWKPLVNGFGNSRPPDFDKTAAVISWFPSLPAVAQLQALGVRYVVVHTDSIPDIRGRLARAEGRPDVTLIAQDGSDRLYRINALREMPVGAVLRSLPWAELTYVERPSQLSYLAGGKDIGPFFGLQRPDQMFVYLEDTSAASTLMLRLPTAMHGRFYDATTGSMVGEVMVESTTNVAGPPATVALPSDRQSMILDLRVIN